MPTSDSQLLTCPRCQTPNFSRAGLRTHRCRGTKPTYERRPLNAAELSAASGGTILLVRPAPELAETESSGQDAAIAAQLVAQYERAASAGARIAEANLDLIVFGGMLAQLEGELAARGGPKRGPGAEGLRNWLRIHAASIPERTAYELRALATSIAKHFALDAVTLNQLLTAGPDTVLAKGQGKIRGQILETLGAGSIHRLHMQFGSRKHGGARVSMKPDPVAPTLEERREQAFRDLGKIVADLSIQVATDELYTMWLTADQLEQIATNLERSVTVMRDRATTMRRADAPRAKSA